VTRTSFTASGNIARQAAFDLAAGLAFGGSAGDVFAGGWLVLDPALDHGVQCVVELAVAVTVEPITGSDLAAVRRDRCHAGEHRERRLGVDTAAVGPRAGTVFFRAPRGAAVKVKYGHGWFSLNVQKQTMDRATHEKLKVDSASIAYARMRMKVLSQWTWSTTSTPATSRSRYPSSSSRRRPPIAINERSALAIWAETLW
jgi:hypothetical protein